MLIRKASIAQDSEIVSKNNVILKGINFLNNARSASLFERMISVLDQVDVRGYANPLFKPLAIATQRRVHSGIRDLFEINPIATSMRRGDDRW